MLGLEVVLQSLLKLWGTELKVETNRDDIHAMSEEIAIAAFDKVIGCGREKTYMRKL